MLKKLITTIEEKFVFNISLYFWHIFIGLSALALIAGLIFLLIGIFPAGKSDVVKQKYPLIVNVTSSEITAIISPVEKNKQINIVKKETQYNEIENKLDTLGLARYEKSLDSLKTLIPPSKYLWTSRGHYYYPYGERYYNRYRNTRYASDYRRWIIDRVGSLNILKNAFRSVNSNKYLEKKKLLDSYLSILKLFPEKKRQKLLKTLTSYSNTSVSNSIYNMSLLKASISVFDTNHTEYIEKLALFGRKNPNDGQSFISFANNILGKFSYDIRMDVLGSLINSYYAYFNNRIQKQIELTNLFSKIKNNFEDKDKSKALATYYSLMIQKNKQREREIRRIDNRYAQELAEAEAEYQRSKIDKEESRLKGVYIIGASIGTIAFIALLLVLLSIQRYIKKIESKLEQPVST